MEKENFNTYSEEEALDEASKMQQKIKTGEVKDYSEAEKMVEEENTKEIKTNHSLFNEHVLTRGRDDLVVDEKEKKLLMDKIRMIASQVEKLLKIREDEELKWDIDLIPPLNEEDLKNLKEQAENESENWTWKFLGSEKKEEGEKIFGPELREEFNNSSRDKDARKEFFKKWQPKVAEYLIKTYKPAWDFMLRANIDVYLMPKGLEESKSHFRAIKHKGEDKAKSSDTNINLFGDKVTKKFKGEISIEELARLITDILENRKK